MQHYLAPLLKPKSVALVGASEQPGSLGRTVYREPARRQFHGAVYAVNPNHRRVFGRRAYATLAAIGKPIDLAVIAAPAGAVPGILDDARARMRDRGADVVSGQRRRRRRPRAGGARSRRSPRKRGIRLLGPGAFGVVRTDIGLNATFCAPIALPGPARAGRAVRRRLHGDARFRRHRCRWASRRSCRSAAASTSASANCSTRWCTIRRPTASCCTSKRVGDARPFVSALRAAARTKPVVVLKAGRSLERCARRSTRWARRRPTPCSTRR